VNDPGRRDGEAKMTLGGGGMISVLALGLLAAPIAAEAQQPAKVPRIGLLTPGSPGDPFIEAFRQGLRALGYVEGQNIALEYRWAESKYDRLPGLASDLVRLNVDLIFARSTPGARAAGDPDRLCRRY